MEENEPKQVSDMVVALLNQASLARETSVKLEKLRSVQELIVYRDATLLDNFLDEVLGFQHDPSPDIKKFLLGFTELACKRDPEILTKVVANLGFFLLDENVNVKKKVIICLASIYPVALKWVAKMRNVTSAVEQTWEYLVQMKNRLIPLIEDENDGIRTYIIKFMESCVVSQSTKTPTSINIHATEEFVVSLDQIPRDHKLISYRKLEAEGKALFQKILEMLSSQHVSSVNLMTCMTALSNIARQRPDFIEKVILAYEALHVNLPPTLAKSQVSSVRKALKTHLLTLLKHPASMPYQPQMTTLLTDLGATQVQVLKALPAGSDLRRRIRRADNDPATASGDTDESGTPSKRSRLDQQDGGPSGSNVNEEDEDEALQDSEQLEERRRNSAIDITAEYLYKKLTPQNVADLVLLSMIVLPDSMPPQFQSSFTPIAAAGTEAQIRHLSRLMANQFTALGVGPGAEQQAKQQQEQQQLQLQQQQQQQKAEAIKLKNKETLPKTIESVVSSAPSGISSTAAEELAKELKPPVVPLMPAGFLPGIKTSKRFHQFGLAHITKPMDPEMTQKMTLMAFERILNAEKRVINGGASMAHMKILIAVVSEFNNVALNNMLETFVLSDQKSRSDLAILWIYYEFSRYQKAVEDFSLSQQRLTATPKDTDVQSLIKSRDQAFEKYDRCLSTLLGALLQRGEHKESLFHKILLEAPLITPNSLHILQQACLDPVHGSLSLITLREMIMTRPKQRNEILSVLIDFTCFEKTDLRHPSLEIAKELYQLPHTKMSVYKYVEDYLETLELPAPTKNLFGKHRGRLENPGRWEEDSIKACLYLFLYLLPVDYSLMHKLADVYVKTSNEIKRVILRLIESPIKAGGIQSPELLSLIENFPKGAETLVTKIVNLLTERNPPTLDLVRRVRNLYHERVPDVRFLIPVLSGLQEKEIIAALPKLIRLNQNVVKEVFNRLLHGKNLETGQQSLTPVKLLTAIGQMEFTSSEEAKPILTAADLLLNDRAVYTKETLASVIQILTEYNPLPTQLMRIVIRALSYYPALINFVIMNILQRLIIKQVWTQPQVWQGFIKCCMKTRPQSFQVLMQWKLPQLTDVFESSPELKSSLMNHVNSLSSHQPIPSDVRMALGMEVATNRTSTESATPVTEDTNPVSSETPVQNEREIQSNAASSE